MAGYYKRISPKLRPQPRDLAEAHPPCLSNAAEQTGKCGSSLPSRAADRRWSGKFAERRERLSRTTWTSSGLRPVRLAVVDRTAATSQTPDRHKSLRDHRGGLAPQFG